MISKPVLAAALASAISCAVPAQAAELFNESTSGDVDAAKLDSMGNLTPFMLPNGTSSFAGSINSGTGDSTDSYLFEVLAGQAYTNFALTVSGVEIASGATINLYDSSSATAFISNQQFGNYSTALNLAPGLYTLTLGGGVVVGSYNLAVTAGGLNVIAPVPEPATWLTMLLGFAGVGLATRRTRRAKARIAYA